MPLSATQSRMRARSSSSSRKRRRTGSRSARSRTSEAVRRRPARSISWATTPSTGLVWRSERSARRTRRSVGRSASGSGSNSSSSTTSPAPNVAWISGANVSMSGHITITSRGCSVSSSSSRWRIASRRTSTWRARPWQEWIWMLRSLRGERPGLGAAVVADVGLDAGEQRVVAGCDRVVVGDVLVRAEHELHLARVLTPGGEQAVVGEGGGGVVGAADDRRRGRRSCSHSAGEGWRRKTCTSRPAARARSTSRWPGREAGQAEERDALGEVAQRRRCAEPLARRLEPLGGAGVGEPLPQPPPQLGLPGRLFGHVDLAPRPAAHHRRPVQRVAVEQLGEVADGGEPPRAPVGVVLAAQVGRQAVQPRLLQALADDLEQRPDGALRRPRVGLGVDARRGRDRVADELVRERERDVRADAVGSAGGGAEARGEALGQPALHPPGRNGDDVGLERVGQWVRE